MIERKILIGLITSNEFIKNIREFYKPNWFESETARIIAIWAIEYYDKYNKVISNQLHDIYLQKLKDQKINKDLAEELSEDILPELSNEYLSENLDIEFLTNETINYFKERQLILHAEEIENNIKYSKQGTKEKRIEDVNQLINEFKPLNTEIDLSLDFSSKNVKKAVKEAFESITEPLIRYPKALGEFWNTQLVRGALVAILAIAKRGKTFLLLDLVMKAIKQGRNVAFFQAGDMNQNEQLKRIGVYLTGRSNLEKYCGEHYQAVPDCLDNQLDQCSKSIRESEYGAFVGLHEDAIKQIEFKELKEIYDENPDYLPCTNCPKYKFKKSVWLKKIDQCAKLEMRQAQRAITRFFKRNKGSLKLSTHANGTLSVLDIENIIQKWVADGFVPDVILIDYVDLLRPNSKTEFRHQRNEIWKNLRKLSQTPLNGKLPLVIVPTQADAEGYKAHRLTMSNYNEDRRMNDHVTALYGLNQDRNGREKDLGLLRINEILIREGEFNPDNEVTVIQNLRRGRAIVTSM